MGFIRERDGRHQALYLDPTGKRRSAGTFKTDKAAREALLTAETKKRAGQWTDPADGKTTFSEYVTSTWTPNRLVRPTTFASEAGHLKNHLIPAFGHMPLAHITPTVVQGWVTRTINAGASPKTLRNIHGTLRAILRRAVIDRYITSNPAAVADLPLVPTKALLILTPAQEDAILANVTDRWRILVALLAETGMRWGELQALRVRHVDFMRRTLLIEESCAEVSKSIAPGRFVFGPTKSNRIRKIKLTEATALLLSAHVAERNLEGDDLLAGSGATRPMSRGNFHNRVWKPAVKAAGLPKAVRVHDLRHTHASWLLAGGADLKVVMDRLGHSNLSTTQRYLHTMPDADEVALDALARVRNGS